MHKIFKTQVKARLEAEAWMNVANPNLTMEQAVEKLEALGNEILEIDYGNRRVKVMQETLDSRLVWKCDFCNYIGRTEDIVREHEKQCSLK